MYPEKKIHSMIDEHVKKLIPYSGECEYQLDFRKKDRDKPWGVATTYHPPLIENHNKVKKLEKDGYKFNKLDKLTLITHNSLRKINPIFYKNHMPRTMFITEILQLIDRTLDNFN